MLPMRCATESSPVILETREVSVRYPGTLALDAVSFCLRLGKISALIGQNGAGKSTLVKVLAGITPPTHGSLFLDGAEIRMHSVRDADAYGIGIIHQELNLCPNLSIAENIYLARELTDHGVLDKRRQEDQTAQWLAKLEHPIDPRTPVGELPLGEQQIVEIAKALSREVRVLMMDEPTSALSAGEIAVLFRIIRDLASLGVAILYISHRLEELLEIADHVSVLRDGRLVAEAAAGEVDTGWIVRQMTGRAADSTLSAGSAQAGPELLRLQSLLLPSDSARFFLYNVSLNLHVGEVVGIYGLMGAGRTELLECIMGLRPEVSGHVFMDSTSLDDLDTAARIAFGLAMVPEDRQAAGLVQSLSVLANTTLSSLDRFTRGPWLSPSLEQAAATDIAAKLDIKIPSLRYEIGSLSGGNQQKVAIAKCLLTKPRVLLLDEPTRGVDVAAKRDIHSIIQRLAASGMGIILVSSELEEIRATAHRVIVLSRGTIAAEFAASEVSDDALAIAASAANRRNDRS